MRGAVSSGEGGEPGEVSTRASAAAHLLHLWGRHLPDLACRQPLAAARSRPSVVTSEARRRTASLLVRLHYVFCGPDRLGGRLHDKACEEGIYSRGVTSTSG